MSMWWGGLLDVDVEMALIDRAAHFAGKGRAVDEDAGGGEHGGGHGAAIDFERGESQVPSRERSCSRGGRAGARRQAGLAGDGGLGIGEAEAGSLDQGGRHAFGGG